MSKIVVTAAFALSAAFASLSPSYLLAQVETPRLAANQTKSTYKEGDAKITISVTNKTGQALDVYWVDYEGKEAQPAGPSGVVPAGAEKFVMGTTYPGNLYRFKIKGKLLQEWVIQNEQPHLTIQQAMDAAQVNQTKSTYKEGDAKVTISVTNKTGQALDVYWVDYEGKEAQPAGPSGVVPAGAEKFVMGSTYPGNLYRFKMQGKLLQEWVIKSEQPHLTIQQAMDGGASPKLANELTVPIYAQQTGMWCWATSGEMIMEHLGFPIVQCKQANDYYPTASGKDYEAFVAAKIDCCTVLSKAESADKVDERIVLGGWPQWEKYGFTFSKKITKEYNGVGTDVPLTFEEIKGQIDNNRPVGFAWGWTDGGGHYMVLTGYKTALGKQWVKIHDPGPVDKDKKNSPELHTSWKEYSYWCKSERHVHWRDDYDIKKKD